MDYKKLKLKIKEVFDTQEAFAKAMGLSRVESLRDCSGL